MSAQVFNVRPADFNPAVEVAAIYVLSKGKVLLLQRSQLKSESGNWGVPAGKIEKGESPLQAAKRELFEETSIEADGFTYLGKLFMRKPDIEYVYHSFMLKLDAQPEIRLCTEHDAYTWASKNEAESLTLMAGGKYALDAFYNSIPRKPFYFVRHGQTDFNVSKLKTDHGDVSLNARGVEQAQAIESIIAALPIQHICCSPLKRAQETKQIISSRLNAVHYEMANLGECTLQIWTDMTANEQPQHVVEFMEQVKFGLIEALAFEGPTLIVAHGGIHWAICSLLGIAEHDWYVDNCAPVHFFPDDSGQWNAHIL